MNLYVHPPEFWGMSRKEYRLPDNLAQKEQLGEFIQKGLEELKKAEDNSYGVLVDTTIVEKKDSSGWEFEIWHFRYDREADVWICPKGGVLRFEREQKHRGKGYMVRVYRCQGYEGCAHRWKCSKNKKGRTIGVSPYHLAIVNQLEKQKQAKNKHCFSGGRR
jgi:hypothetical protein